MPNPSPRDGTTTIALRSYTGATGETRPRNVTPVRAPPREARPRAARRRRSRASSSGTSRARRRERAQQHVEPLDRDQPPDGDEPRLGGRRRRLRRRLDAVVHDRERGAVEALGRGEVVGEAGGDRDLRVREPRRGAVGARDEPVRAELVEAVLRRDAHRHARERAGGQPEHVGVDEVGVQDRPAAAASSRAGTVGSRSKRIRHASVGTPAARIALDELGAPGSPSCSTTHRARRTRASRSRGSSESRCASEPETPETFCTWSTRVIALAARRSRSAQCSTEWSRATRRAQLARRLAARPSAPGAPSHDAAGERRATSSCAKRSALPSSSAAKPVLATSTGRQAARGLVHDLVERARAHVVHEHVGRRVHLADPRARHRRLDARAARDELLRGDAALLVGQRRPADLQLDAVAAHATASTIVSSPFAGDVRPSASSRRTPSSGPRAAGGADVDAVPDRHELVATEAGTSARRR